jgi:hypothetical protein
MTTLYHFLFMPKKKRKRNVISQQANPRKKNFNVEGKVGERKNTVLLCRKQNYRYQPTEEAGSQPRRKSSSPRGAGF